MNLNIFILKLICTKQEENHLAILLQFTYVALMTDNLANVINIEVKQYEGHISGYVNLVFAHRIKLTMVTLSIFTSTSSIYKRIG